MVLVSLYMITAGFVLLQLLTNFHVEVLEGIWSLLELSCFGVTTNQYDNPERVGRIICCTLATRSGILVSGKQYMDCPCGSLNWDRQDQVFVAKWSASLI